MKNYNNEKAIIFFSNHPPIDLDDTFGEIVSRINDAAMNGLTHIRVARRGSEKPSFVNIRSIDCVEIAPPEDDHDMPFFPEH